MNAKELSEAVRKQDGNPKISGILFEGGCFSGKSTLIRAVASMLHSEFGISTSAGHCYVENDSIVEALHRRALQQLPSEPASKFMDEDFFYGFSKFNSASIMIDSYLAASKAWPVSRAHLQDRHWFSQLCQNQFFNCGDGVLSKEWIRSSSPQFTLHVYLTCSDEVREERASRLVRDGENAMHRHFRRYLKESAEYDLFCSKMWPQESGYITVETGDDPVERVAESVCKEFALARESEITSGWNMEMPYADL
jgi:hypothetical protein